MKICMECKWCSYNYEQQQIKAIKNPIKRFFAWCDWVQFGSKLHSEFPKCKHPNVYVTDNGKAAVFGDHPPAREDINCTTAREKGWVGQYHTFLCCEKEGKYWEAKDE
jgi:hypothetical protein